jgi:hypothetical protein
MAIGFRASSSADKASAAATETITKPTGTASTDILVIAFGTDKGSNVAQTITPPSGWTRIGAQVSQTNGASQIVLLDAFWSLGSNASLGFGNSVSGAAVQQGWVCGAFTGVDNTTPIDVADGTGNKGTFANTLTVNGVTIVTDQAWDCFAAADWLGGVFSATSFTVAENGHTNASAALLYNTTPKSTGATGTVTFSDTLGGSGTQIMEAIRFALRPAVTATKARPPFRRRVRWFTKAA